MSTVLVDFADLLAAVLPRKAIAMTERIKAQELRKAPSDYLNSHASIDNTSRMTAGLEPEQAGLQEQASLRQRLFHRLSSQRLAPLAITVLASICVIQAWLLWSIQCTQQLPSRGASGVQTSGVEVAVANLRVEFKAGVSISQMEAALEKAHAGVVTGPLPGHIYLLDALNGPASLHSLQNSGTVGTATLIEATRIQ